MSVLNDVGKRPLRSGANFYILNPTIRRVNRDRRRMIAPPSLSNRQHVYPVQNSSPFTYAQHTDVMPTITQYTTEYRLSYENA
jgi:hypothetical protein